MGRCVRQCEAAATTKVLTLSIRMQKSRAEIIEHRTIRRVYNAPVCSAATVYTYSYGIRIHMCTYVCVDFVIVVCKSCLTTRYEFVEYEARNMVADTVVFIVPLIEYANAFSHVRPVSRQRQTATATKS